MTGDEKLKTLKMQQMIMDANESAIDSWKDTRLKKLDEFKRDLLASANSRPSGKKNSGQQDFNYESYTGVDSDFNSIENIPANPN